MKIKENLDDRILYLNNNFDSFINSNKNLDCSKEENEILDKISKIGNLSAYFESLIEKCTKTLEVTEIQDEEMCKIILTGIKYEKISPELDFKLISLIIAHFSDIREDFIDRACYLATAFYKKNEFDVEKRKTFKKYENFLSKILTVNKQRVPIKSTKFNEIINIDAPKLYDHYDNKDVILFDEFKSPVFLQKAIQILKSGENINQIKAVHHHFKSILDRSSTRTIRIYSNEIFNKLVDISSHKLIDDQFKSLAFFIQNNMEYLDALLTKFKDIPLESMRVYILFTLNLLVESVDFDRKIEIHLKFSQMFLNLHDQLEGIVQSHAILFIENGMKLLKDL